MSYRTIWMWLGFLTFGACFDDRPIVGSRFCRHNENGNPYSSTIAVSAAETLAATRELPPLPDSFVFGVATAAYQIEAGNGASDWAEWERLGKVKNGDRADDGPRSDELFQADLAALSELNVAAYRLSIEWARVFPTRESFEALTPNPEALAYYRSVLLALRTRGIAPMVTLQHFTLPNWLQSSVGTGAVGLSNPAFILLFESWAKFCAEEFGDLVDEWITLNEPMAMLAAGYAVGQFPPGRSGEFKQMQEATRIAAFAHARAYEAIHEKDRVDADGDGTRAMVSFATHARAWLPYSANAERDVIAARRQRYINNLVTLDAVVCGNLDEDWDEEWEETARSDLRQHLDFIALNFYSNAAASYLDFEPFLGIPAPANLPNQLAKNDLGWDLSPASLRQVIDELAPYGLPIVITENGVADSLDNRRPKNLVDTVREIQALRVLGYDIRGYYHWSLIDNFEWDYGFCPRFGLYAVDYSDPARRRTPRASASLYQRIVRERGASNTLAAQYPTYGTDVVDCQ